jgi:CDI immunity proteins
VVGDEGQGMKEIDFDLGRSLQDLEGVDWGEPNYESSLVIECHRLRRLPLKDFKVENLQRMIRQQIGLPFLVPLALRELRERPHADGDLYEGALLNAVLHIEAAFWNTKPDLASELLALLNNLSPQFDHLASFERNGVLKVLDESGSVFLARCGISGASLVCYGKPKKNEEMTDDDMTAWAAKLSS